MDAATLLHQRPNLSSIKSSNHLSVEPSGLMPCAPPLISSTNRIQTPSSVSETTSVHLFSRHLDNESNKSTSGNPSEKLEYSSGVESSDQNPENVIADIVSDQLVHTGVTKTTSYSRSPSVFASTAVVSAIPQPQPSAIPRLVTHHLPFSLGQTDSNNCAIPSLNLPLNARPYTGPIGLPQTTNHPPFESQLRSFPPAAPPPIDPPDLVDPGFGYGPFACDRSRAGSRHTITYRPDRSVSEHPQRSYENESDTSSIFSSSGAPRRITSKIDSLKNVHYKPGGGNVTIVNEKVDLGPIKGKCNSFSNVKYKPGGGSVQIVDAKIDVSAVRAKIDSMKNVRHSPTGGDVQIVSEKLEFNKAAASKVGSLKNARHQPGGGKVQIYNETLPWLKHNKPNLPLEEKARINKQRSTGHGEMVASLNSSGSSHTGMSRS